MIPTRPVRWIAIHLRSMATGNRQYFYKSAFEYRISIYDFRSENALLFLNFLNLKS